jgi:hypothetical protein
VIIVMAAAAGAAAARQNQRTPMPRKPKKPQPKRAQGQAQDTKAQKRSWFAALRERIAAEHAAPCMLCRVENGEWLGVSPKTHTCARRS